MQARHCFERAGLPNEKAVAYAYYLREQARMMVGRSGSQILARTKAFLTAAHAFASCAQHSLRQKGTYLRVAGDCYVLGQDEPAAARAYLDASQFTLAARHFRKAGMFDEAVEVIQTHRVHMDSDVAEDIMDLARLYYFKERKLEYVPHHW